MTVENRTQKNILCVNLKKLTGLVPLQIDTLLSTIVDCMVHELVLQSANYCEGIMQNISIELPDIGRLDLTFDNKKVSGATIVLEDEFKLKVEGAVFGLESPLINRLSNKMSEKISSKYKSVL